MLIQSASQRTAPLSWRLRFLHLVEMHRSVEHHHTHAFASRRDASLRDAKYSWITCSTERCNPADCRIAQPFMLQ
jgi:hypothetical protein